jgi:ribosomal protein S18 acetylase RimI-like enzyme
MNNKKEGSTMRIVSTESFPKNKTIDFFRRHWGSPMMVVSTGVYDCSKLNGFGATNDSGDIIGLVTFVIKNFECEIVSLDSLEEGKGIGTALVVAVETVAIEKNCSIIKLITTNDNLLALKFYQKRNYVLTELIPNAVERARKIKPQIPLIGNDGIPIRDELVLQKVLTK